MDHGARTNRSELAEKVRKLGFDPSFLTPQEWEEVIEIHSLFGQEALPV